LRRIVLAATLFSTGLAGASCSCPSSNILIDDFEGCGASCGWTIAGTGGASIVSTILPGEHGLRIAGGSTAAKTISPALIDSTYSVSLVGDCPDGIGVSLVASVTGAADITVAVMLAIDDSLDTNGNPPSYTGATYVPLVGGISLPSGVTSATVRQVTLEPATGGTCTVDLVRLTEAEPCSG
jgi:hypothetical protein